MVMKKDIFFFWFCGSDLVVIGGLVVVGVYIRLLGLLWCFFDYLFMFINICKLGRVFWK